MEYINGVCSFTGYRTKKLKDCLRLSANSLKIEDVERNLKKLMLEMLDGGVSVFQCGMAIGSDLMFARIALELKREYSGLVKFIAVLPCLGHDIRWHPHDRFLCREYVEKADDIILVSNSYYYNGCMAKRNRHLVDTCSELLSVYDGREGGTMQTVDYAKGREKKITMVDPSKELIIVLRESFEKTYRKEFKMY